MSDTQRAPGGPYNVAQIADVLQRSERTIRREITEDKLPAAKVGRAYVITRTDLVAYLGTEERVDDLFGHPEPATEADE